MLHTFTIISSIAIIFVSTIKQNLENSRGKGSLLFLPIFHDVFFLPDISGFRLLSFPFFQGASFSHYFTIGLPVMNSLSFPSSKNVLISPSLLKDIFLWIQGSGLIALFFQHLKNIVPLSSGHLIFDEKSSVFQTAFPIQVRCHFSVAAFEISFFSFQKFDYDNILLWISLE